MPAYYWEVKQLHHVYSPPFSLEEKRAFAQCWPTWNRPTKFLTGEVLAPLAGASPALGLAGTRAPRTSVGTHGASLKDVKVPCAEVAWGSVCRRLPPELPVWKSPENIPWVPTPATSAPVIYCTLLWVSALIPQLLTAFKQRMTKQLMTCFCSNRH